MCTSYKGYAIQRIVLAVVFLLPLLLFKPVLGLSESPPKSSERTRLMTIEGKTSDAILISDHRFIVTESTTILNMRGRTIRFSALPVPCRAQITYRLRVDGDPVVLEIKVEKLLKASRKS